MQEAIYSRFADPPLRLALAAMRTYVGVAGPDELPDTLPTSEKAWAEVIKRLDVLRLCPLLDTVIAQAGLQHVVPETVRAHLKHGTVRTAVVAVAFESALVEATSLLVEGGFDVFAIKGAALSVLSPQYAQLRRPADIDLWVPGGRADAAYCLMQSSGYRQIGPDAHRSGYHRHCGMLARAGEGVAIELHRRPWLTLLEADRYPVAPIIVEAHGAGISVPSIEELVVIHAAHSAVCDVAPGQLLTLLDIALMLQGAEVDWDLVELLSRRIGSLRGVRAVLSRVAMLGLAPVPARLRMDEASEVALTIEWADTRPTTSKLLRIRRRRTALDGNAIWLRSLVTELPSSLLNPRLFARRCVGELRSLCGTICGSREPR